MPKADTSQSDYYDADVIVAMYDLSEFIRQCGFDLNKNEMLCPKGHDSKTKSFKINAKNTKMFKCFGCQWTGNVITFAKHVGGSDDYKNAVELIRGHKPIAKIVKPMPVKRAVEREVKIDYEANKNKALLYKDNLAKNPKIIAYLNKRGLTDKTIKAYVLGANGNDLAMPVFDVMKRVVGFKYRSIKGKSYKAMTGLKKSDYLYSLRALPYIQQAKSVYLLEGEIDAMSLYEIGIKNVLALMGSDFSDRQFNIIKPIVDKVIVIPDNDDGGELMAKRVIDVAGDRTEILRLDYGDFKDANDLLVAGKLKDAVKNAKIEDIEVDFKTQYLAEIDKKASHNKHRRLQRIKDIKQQG